MRLKEGNKEKDIREAAIEIFAKVGFHNAKISKIAARARVAAGSVYLYYKNKEEILVKIFEDLWGNIHAEVEGIVLRKDLNAVEKFDAMIDTIFDLFIESPALALIFVNEHNFMLQRIGTDSFSYYDKFLNLGEKIIEEGKKNKLFNENLDTKVFRNFAFGGVRHLLHQWAQNPAEYKLTMVRQSVKFILKKGITL